MHGVWFSTLGVSFLFLIFLIFLVHDVEWWNRDFVSGLTESLIKCWVPLGGLTGSGSGLGVGWGVVGV